MKRIAYLAAMLLALGLTPHGGNSAMAQQYSFTFNAQGCKDTMLYLGQHYRDEMLLIDSVKVREGKCVFAGRRAWTDGIYALVRQDGKTVLTNFLVTDSRTFTISGDATLSSASIKVQGSKANKMMFEYMAVQDAARREADSLRKAGSTEGMEALTARMEAYEAEMDEKGKDNLYLQLVKVCEPPTVPDSVSDKPYYYRLHFWDPFFSSTSRPAGLFNSPQMFNKLNFFFFGVLYHADSDTIIRDIDRLMVRIGDDTALARYVIQFIEPRYYRSTRNVGWDAVWCHIASEYILKGRCPWMRESEVYIARQNYNRIRQSLIGAHGQELIMMDTTQIDAPEHWFSSHRLPNKYVILWFWDPDCHHCQEQSAELKILYDSLMAAGDHRLEVYAIGYDSDVAKWKRYVKDHEFRWINVGGNNVNIDYQEAYNVHGAPTMIILNERRDIIMNKVLPIKNLLKFLEAYEKQARKP